MAARFGRDRVHEDDFDRAKDKVLMGSERERGHLREASAGRPRGTRPGTRWSR
jgi:ATP-dependent Zn protease